MPRPQPSNDPNDSLVSQLFHTPSFKD
jgi:MFS family permease